MENKRIVLRGEAALLAAIIINSIGVLLMLQSGSGISAISSVPYAFSEVFPNLSLGTWTYIFQGLLVITLMVLKKRFVPSYLFSFVADHSDRFVSKRLSRDHWQTIFQSKDHF